MFVPSWAVLRRGIAWVLFAIALTGCSGGGGGGGGGQPPAGRGTFTLSATTVSFNAKRLAPVPAAVTLQMQLTGTEIATVGAAYREGMTPAPWLSVNIAGSGTSYLVSFRASNTQLPAGTHSATISVGTADASGNILQYKDVQVSYSLVDGVSILSSPVSVTATVGHGSASFPNTVSVAAPADRQWALSADVPWITLPATVQQGSRAVPFTVDTSALVPGNATGTITATSTVDPTDNGSLRVSVTMNAPTIVVNVTPPLRFGGETGLVMEPRTVRFTLGTGSRVHPWSATFTSTSGGNWLQTPVATGMVNDLGIDVVMTPAPAGVSAGVHTGELIFTVNVNGTPVTKSVPVTLNMDSQRIWASASGVGLSSFPSRQTLTRTLRVFNSLDRSDVPLQVSSDQSWLQASAPNGSSVVLTANPGALAIDELHLANVTISTSDPLIANQDTVRVALWRGSTDPVLVTIPTSAIYLAAHPVEPLFFSVGLSGDVEVRNVYTGALVRTLDGVGVGPLQLSGDGSVLYVGDGTTMRIIGVDSTTGTPVRSYQTSLQSYPPYPLSLTYARPDGHPILISGQTGEVFDVQSGAASGQVDGGGQVVASKDGRRVYVQIAGISPTAMQLTEVRYSSFNSLGFSRVRSSRYSGALDDIYSPSNGLDIALTEDDSALYRANGSPYGFGVADPVTLVSRLFLPATAYAAAIECGWRGYCFGSAGPDWTTHQDIWIYDSNQQNVGGYVLGAQNLYQRGLLLSADDHRLIVGHTVPSDVRRITILNTPQ